MSKNVTLCGLQRYLVFQANELRLERRSELFLPAFFIGGAKGPGTYLLQGLKSKRQVVLVQAVRKRGVMIFLSWQLPVRVPQRPSTPKVSRLFPLSVFQINLLDCFRICVQVSVKERLCNISRASPDLSHLTNVFSRRFLSTVKNKNGVPSCCLESPLLGGALSSTCLQRWPRIRAQQHAGNTLVFVASLPPSQPEKWTIFALKVARNKSSLLVMQLSILDAMNNKCFPLVSFMLNFFLH
ncbi:uncharacterized protein [Syngnathus scovelli]|uniref:uncharacterized protein isoform X3 n=1 Tax=Syngnathus scovelli TaxID=161590 RepID=UPI0035C96803